MKPRLLRLSALLAGSGLALLVAAVLWHNWGDLLSAPRHSPAPVTPETLLRGEYLVRAGNCIACHTTRGGVPPRALWQATQLPARTK